MRLVRINGGEMKRRDLENIEGARCSVNGRGDLAVASQYRYHQFVGMQGDTIFVDTRAKRSGNGLSINSPFRTLAEATEAINKRNSTINTIMNCPDCKSPKVTQQIHLYGYYHLCLVCGHMWIPTAKPIHKNTPQDNWIAKRMGY